MRQTNLAFPILFAVCFFLQGAARSYPETVLVHTHLQKNVDFDEKQSTQLVLAFETGIMEVLFDQGHIIFNTGEMHPTPAPSSLSNMAAMGGAGFILTSDLSFGERIENHELSARVTYSLFSVRATQPVITGELVSDDVMNARAFTPTGLSLEMGSFVAHDVIDRW